MLTAHCRRAAGLSFLQINGPTYYFPNCPLAQLAVWGTSSPGMNTVASISSRGPVQAYAALVPNCVCVVRHLHTRSSWNVGSLNGKNLKERKEKRTRLTAICSEGLTRVKGIVVRLLDLPSSPCCQAVIPERQEIQRVIYIISDAAVFLTSEEGAYFFSHSLNILQCCSPLWVR